MSNISDKFYAIENDDLIIIIISVSQDFSFRGLREQKGVVPLFWSRPLFLAEKRSFPLFSGLYIGVHRTEKQRGINNLSE